MLFENTFRLSTRIESNQKYLDTLNTYVAVQLINKERCFTEQNMPIWCWLKKAEKMFISKSQAGIQSMRQMLLFLLDVHHILRFLNFCSPWIVTVQKTALMWCWHKKDRKNKVCYSKRTLLITVAVTSVTQKNVPRIVVIHYFAWYVFLRYRR